MIYEYEVPFELTFNSEYEVMNNLIVHDLTVQDKIVISESKIKYLFENDTYIDLVYKTTVESISDEEKEKILSDNPETTFEYEENISTIIYSNKPFKLSTEIEVESNNSNDATVEFLTAYITFSQV